MDFEGFVQNFPLFFSKPQAGFLKKKGETNLHLIGKLVKAMLKWLIFVWTLRKSEEKAKKK